VHQTDLLQKTVIAAALALAFANVACAQEAPATDKPIQKVVVTGSNIAHIDAETATPVTILRREDIARTGANTVSELLATLTSATGSLNDIGGSLSFAGGASSASLRNLGKQSTLVLLNSRRVAPYALADYNEVFTNLDSLPLDAIDRIEVLRNGGSAVYGSDAVAGVINIITRNDFRGVQVSATQDQSIKTNKFKSRKGSITGGMGDFASDGYNVLANLEVYRRDNVMWRQVVDEINPAYGEKFTAVAPGSGRMFGNRGAPSSYSYPGNIIGQGPVTGCTTVAAGLCQYDRFSRFQAVPEAKRVNGLVSGKLRISDKVDGFAEVLYSHTETDYLSAFQTYGATVADAVWGDPSTGQQRTFVYRGLPATHPLNKTGKEADFRYRFADSPGSENVVSSQYRALTGLRGNWNNFDWETAAGVMGGKTSMQSRGALSDSGFKQVIGDYTTDDPNFFNHDYKIGQQNSADVLNRLFPMNGYDGKITQYFVDGKISGDVAHIDGRGVGLAVGAELRHEKFDITPTDNLLAGDIVSNGASSAHAKRNTGAAYVEVSVPVTATLELDAAARIDKYQGFDSHTSPKIAFRYTPFKQLMLRGTVESGFRAPNLTESAQSSKFAFNNGVQDPKRCPQALALAQDLRARADAGDPNAALLTARADAVEGNECAGGVASNVRNNPNLKPETSRSSTLGFVLEPAKGYTLSVDYWHIERKGEIGLKSTQELLAAEADQAAGVITRNPIGADKTFTPAERAQYGVTVGSLAGTSGMFENVSKTKTSGVDLSGSARIPTRFGKVSLDANATYLLDLRTFSTTRNGYGDNLAGRYVEASGSFASKVVANATLALETGSFTNSVRGTFQSHTELRGDFFDEDFTTAGCENRGWTASECKIASYVRWDYSLSYRGFKGWTLNAFVRNVLNHRPPVDLRTFASQGSVIPQNYEDVQGRMLRLTAEYRF
jgi:iron complex outermembrane receptor protein